MTRLWKWIAGAAGGLAALLLAVLAAMHWRREKERRDHGYEMALKREEKERAESEGELGRVLAETAAADQAAEAAAEKAVAAEVKGGSLSDFLNARTRPGVRDGEPKA